MSSVSLNVRIKLAGLLMLAEAFPRKVSLSVPQLGGVLTPPSQQGVRSLLREVDP